MAATLIVARVRGRGQWFGPPPARSAAGSVRSKRPLPSRQGARYDLGLTASYLLSYYASYHE